MTIDKHFVGEVGRNDLGSFLRINSNFNRNIDYEAIFDYLDKWRSCRINKNHLPFELRIPSKPLTFLDIESRGLHNYDQIFLIGITQIDQGEVKIDQYLARDPFEEGAMLQETIEILNKSRNVITFNGASFDMDRIKKRARVWTTTELKGVHHLDLYRAKPVHLSLASEGVPENDRSLQTFERYVLGYVRQGDLSGALAPEIYRRYITRHKIQRQGDSKKRERLTAKEEKANSERLAEIIKHNLIDTLSIACLYAFACQYHAAQEAVYHKEEPEI